MKVIKFNATFYDVGVPKYEAGKHYPVTEETQRQVTAGIAEEIDAYVDTDEAEKLAEKAQKNRERAVVAADVADGLLKAARAVDKIKRRATK